jgi:hypothetical protein
VNADGDYVTEPERKVPVAARVDVVVAGAGPAGFAAAVSAARSGANVLLVEQANYVGGMLASQAIHGFYSYQGKQIIFGIPQELVNRLVAIGACVGHIPDQRLGSVTATDVERLKVVTQEMVAEAGAKPLLHTLVSAPVMEGKTVKGIIVENKSGRQAVLARVVVDATGDADVAARAGVPFEIKPKDAIQPGTLMFRMDHVDVDKIRLALARDDDNAHMVPGFGANAEYYLRAERFALDGFRNAVQRARENGDLPPDYPQRWAIVATQPREDEVFINMAMVTGFHAIDAWELTRAEMEARRWVPIVVNFLKKYIPGFANAHLISTHNTIGVRESRRIVGDYVLGPEDVMQGRTFADGVAIAPWRPSMGHHPKGNFVDDPHDERYPRRLVRGCEVPYGCLLPKGVEGLLVAGRAISATGEGQNAIRVMAPCMSLGQAAGTAAALAAREGITPRQLDGAKVRAALVQQGVRFLEVQLCK